MLSEWQGGMRWQAERTVTFPLMRIAIVYDCLYPNTVGGVERWYRSLATSLDERHEITYVTRRQWSRRSGPQTSFRTVAVAPGLPLYTKSGRRSIIEAVVWAAGLFWHLLRHSRSYDVVHTATAPYLSLVAAWLALRLTRSPTKLVVDWFEVWGSDYWSEYLGPVGGRVGHAVEVACTRMPDHNFTFSSLHAGRLAGHRGHRPVTRLTGLYGETRDPALARLPRDPERIVFAGRHIPEKRVGAIPPAVARARESVPAMTCTILGDGPESAKVAADVERLGLADAIDMRGKVSAQEVSEALATAACMLLPSRREGYGLVVVEAAARGTPVVVVDAADNSAPELVEQGVNGVVADSADPEVLGAALVRVVRAGEEMRRSTREWYERNAHRLSVDSSIEQVERTYRDVASDHAR